jgi:GNAT superfamily N-acetyltransferase
MIYGFIDKIVNYRREHGSGQLFRRCLVRLINTLFFYQKEVVGCISLLDPVPPACPKIPVTIRAAMTSDIPELKTIAAGYRNRDYLQWINDRYIFHVAQLKDSPAPCGSSSIQAGREAGSGFPPPERSSGKARSLGPGNKIIGYACVCPAKKSDHKLVSILKLTDSDYWAMDAYIHPEYRGKGINSAIASGFLTQAKREGYKRGFGTILIDNNASRRSYAFLGEKEIGVFTTIILMGCTFYFLKKNKDYEELFNK